MPVPTERSGKLPPRRWLPGWEYGSIITIQFKIWWRKNPIKSLFLHIGAPAQPVVVVGDRVCAGDLIAQPKEGALGARIHASISGRVQQVGTRIVIGKE